MTTARRATVTLLALVVASVASAADELAIRSGHGIQVEAVQQIDARQLNVRVATSALQQPVDVRILLPSRYAVEAERRYPVLYLFHGTSGRASDWVNLGRAVETTAGLPLIVVMPDAGFDGDGGGWFTNWWNGGALGQPMWETFHVEQVIPWIDANLRTVGKRTGRAIAGLSQGAFGALSYAARHPDMFTSVASFSGACVVDRDPQAIEVSTAIIQYTTTVLSGIADPDAIFGPRATQELNWQAHDPGTLVTNLRGMHIALWTGDGSAGPFDKLPLDPGATGIESITFGATQLFDRYLDAAGIRHTYDYYGGGTHTWPYWARDLEEYVGPLMRRLRNPPPAPHRIGYRSTDREWERWGWQVTLEQETRGFVDLARAWRRGFQLTGAGTGVATVRTPPFFRRGTGVRAIKSGPTGREIDDVIVESDGRLRVTVRLGDGAGPATTRVRLRRRPARLPGAAPPR
jgi:S-formylglutathione hydrolase FrmB